MNNAMRGMPFRTFVQLLVELGYAKNDPELEMFYLAHQKKFDEAKKIMAGSDWQNGGVYNRKITDRQIVARYENLLDLPAVRRKYDDMLSGRGAQQGGGRGRA